MFQSGFNTGTFMVMAVASASLMTELLHRPATEFGLYFIMFPVGFFTGNFISTRLGTRFSTETMVLAGSLLAIVTVTGQAVTLSSGAGRAARVLHSGFFITMAQGIAMPYGQAAAMSEIPGLPAPRPASACSCSTCAPRCRASSTGFSPTARRAR